MRLVSQPGPHVLVDDLDKPAIDDKTIHHLKRVLRLRDGDEFTVGNGEGAWRSARFGDAVEADGDVVFEAAPASAITVCFALLKGGRNELIVQKLTEIGVDLIVPIATERCVVRWDDEKCVAQHERLSRVAAEATMQSHRAWLPRVEHVETFTSALERGGACMADVRAPLGNPGGVVLIGPEGGWSDAERGVAAPLVGLTDTVLRAETASIVAATMMVSARSATQR
ncbi:MAG: 16S rRNA (uracil(1498)-N(3))-methyltransferase [Acidobacteria bacterium]|nr:16S rRNA (uracil(1498)-N(3))-methyltransferase [Acidobacteriota bacterium]